MRNVALRKSAALVIAFGSLMAIAAVACGGTETVIQKVVETVVVETQVQVKGDTVVETVIVEKQVQVKGDTVVEIVKETVQVKGDTVTVVETVIVEKQLPPQTITLVATPTPGAVIAFARPMPGSVLNVGVADVGSANFLSPRAVHPNDNRNHTMSVFETMIIQEGEQGALINVAIIDWELDGLVFRATLHPRAEFHQGWGFATAEDWEYTWERTQETGAVNSAAATIRNEWSSWKAIDDVTFEATLKKPNVNFRRALIFGTYLHSKKALLEMGDDWADKNAIGTGPYELDEIVADDRITLKAVAGHYRETPWFETVNLLETPDPLTRIAQLSVGEIDMMPVGIPQLEQVVDLPGVRVMRLPQTGRAGATVFFGGQYYVGPDSPTWDAENYSGHVGTVTSNAGDDLAQERDLTAALENPWIGPYLTDKAENENAINVRRALTHAVDRQLIVDTILGGRGCIGHMYLVDECHPRWDTALNLDYDPDKSRQLLTDAGFPDGFEFPVWIPSGSDTFNEVAEAMVPFWEEIGLTPSLQKTAYTARRPLIISRRMDEVWMMFHGTGVLPFGGVFQWAEMNGRGVWGQNIEYDELGVLADRMFVAVGDETLQWAIQDEYRKFHHDNQLTGGGVFFNELWAIGPAVAAWEAAYHGAIPPQLEKVIPALP